MTAHDDDLLQFNVRLPITIRKMRRSDLAKIEWNGEFKHFRNLFARSFDEQQNGARYLLIADLGGYPIGRIFIQFRGRTRRLANGYSRAYLYSFQVIEALRGCGIGTQLMDAAEQLLIDRQFSTATIAVAKDNEGALRLYRRRGYQTIAEDEGFWRYHDHRGRLCEMHDPCWILEKRLL